MRNPEDRVIYACQTCHDFKKVNTGNRDVECPECYGWPEEKRLELLRVATRDRAEKPSIHMWDLSDDERAIIAQWRLEHPNVHELTLLTWIEGRRYDPVKDDEFLRDARRRFKKWQFTRHSHEGPVPGWVIYALATGDMTTLRKADKQHIEELRRTGG